MNIFALHDDPETCACMHCDKHVVKMLTEYVQLLSTAHRLLDGREEAYLSESGRRSKRWVLDDPIREGMMKATHVNHPSAVWVRKSANNYIWLVCLVFYLNREYKNRFGKIVNHGAYSRMLNSRCHELPEKICRRSFVDGLHDAFPQTMPEQYRVPGDPIQAYRNFYIGDKSRFAKWTNVEVPSWYGEQHASA